MKRQKRMWYFVFDTKIILLIELAFEIVLLSRISLFASFICLVYCYRTCYFSVIYDFFILLHLIQDHSCTAFDLKNFRLEKVLSRKCLKEYTSTTVLFNTRWDDKREFQVKTHFKLVAGLKIFNDCLHLYSKGCLLFVNKVCYCVTRVFTNACKK